MRAAATTTGRCFSSLMSSSSSKHYSRGGRHHHHTTTRFLMLCLFARNRKSTNFRSCSSNNRSGNKNRSDTTRARASSSSSSSSSEQEETEKTTSTTISYAKSGPKQRLDELTLLTNPDLSRNVVQSWIQQGKVLVDGEKITKPGTKLKPNVKIEVLAEEPKFVCRGGLKLEKALQFFEVDVRDKICLDSGLSTGGFTDCLLQQGAKKVYGVDVGYGQVAEKIRVHESVVVMERTNLRYLQPLPDLVELACLDLSFISVLKVLPAVACTMQKNGDLIVLIKPQFEARRDQIGSKGVVRDTKVRKGLSHLPHSAY